MCTKVRRGSHPDLVERAYGGGPKERKMMRLSGLGTGAQFGVHNNSLQNLRRGLVERVFFVEDTSGKLVPAPKPLEGVFEELNYFRSRLHAIVGLHSRILEDKFLSFYSGRRRSIYEAAVKSLSELPVQRQDAFLKTFVKAEKINFSKKPDPAPRVIQPRNVRYNVEVGRYLRRYEHYLYRGIDKIFGGPTIIKGYTVEQIGGIVEEAWNRFDRPVAIGFDMKRFDQHVSVPALEWEHSCYLKSYSNDATLKMLLSWQLVNKGVGFASDGSIKYKVNGCRMSGDMNTSMGNCLLACAITHAFIRKNKIKARLLNNGDDCVLIFERECAAAVKAGLVRHWRRFGFQCELESDADIIEHVEFCQMQPVLSKSETSNYVMVRNPHVSMSKDVCCIGPWNTILHAKKWVQAVGQCGMSLCGGLPVLQAYYGAFIRNSTGVDTSRILLDTSFASGFRELAKLGKRQQGEVDEETRFSFYLAFGILPSAQVALEEDFNAHVINWEFLPQGSQPNPPISCLLLNLK